MNRGEWYKSYTSSSEPNPRETYYHVVDIVEDDRVIVDEYTYFKMLKKLVKNTQKPVIYTTKKWLEQIMRNNMNAVDKEQIPFLLHF